MHHRVPSLLQVASTAINIL